MLTNEQTNDLIDRQTRPTTIPPGGGDDRTQSKLKDPPPKKKNENTTTHYTDKMTMLSEDGAQTGDAVKCVE